MQELDLGIAVWLDRPALRPEIAQCDSKFIRDAPHFVTAMSPARLPLFQLRRYDGRMSFSETIFLFFLALLVFGPKKLPQIARQVGRALNEFRRASNEFKAQIEQEIAHLEHETIPSILPPIESPQGAIPVGRLSLAGSAAGVVEPALPSTEGALSSSFATAPGGVAPAEPGASEAGAEPVVETSEPVLNATSDRDAVTAYQGPHA
jgi:sec-independent protein translocase protein TatB